MALKASETAMPKEITRGYATQFLDALNRVPGHKERILTVKDLAAMDENPVIAGSEPINLDHDDA
jgi:hypothetical protein